MKKLTFEILFVITITFIACQKEPTGVILSADKTETYSGYDGCEVNFTVTAESASTYKWDFGDGNNGMGETVNYGSQTKIYWTYKKSGTFNVKVYAYSKNGKKMAESNVVTITVKRWNEYLIGTYNVKDTSWSYATNSLKYQDYTVKIEDGGDEKGLTVLITNYGNLFPTEKVKKDVHPNTDGGLSVFNWDSNMYPQLTTPNIRYQLSLNIKPYDNIANYQSFKTYGDIKDTTVAYTQGVTAPYFNGNSYWTKQ